MQTHLPRKNLYIVFSAFSTFFTRTRHVPVKMSAIMCRICLKCTTKRGYCEVKIIFPEILIQWLSCEVRLNIFSMIKLFQFHSTVTNILKICLKYVQFKRFRLFKYSFISTKNCVFWNGHLSSQTNKTILTANQHE